MRWVHLFLALLLAFVVLPAVVRGQETAEFYVADVVRETACKLSR